MVAVPGCWWMKEDEGVMEQNVAKKGIQSAGTGRSHIFGKCHWATVGGRRVLSVVTSSPRGYQG